MWDGSDFKRKSHTRAEMSNHAAIDELLCFGHQPGLLESSDIAIFKLAPAFAQKLKLNGIKALENYRLSLSKDEHQQTGWSLSGKNEVTTRAFKYMQEGNVDNSCDDFVIKLKNEKAIVSFLGHKNPHTGFTSATCVDSCRAFLIFPESELAVTATWD